MNYCAVLHGSSPPRGPQGRNSPVTTPLPLYGVKLINLFFANYCYVSWCQSQDHGSSKLWSWREAEKVLQSPLQ